MIKRNLGKMERTLRFLLAAALLGWVVSRGSFGIVEGVAAVASLALLWNSIFARCYLWKWLGLSTRCDSQCSLPDLQKKDNPGRTGI